MTVTTEQVLAALDTVPEPELGGSLVSHQMIKNVTVNDGVVAFAIELTTPACPLKNQIRDSAEAAVRAIPGVQEVQIEMAARTRGHQGLPDKLPIPGVEHVVAVAAGKGGVGKSTVAVNIAVALAQEGARVGLLDADIFGPSVPMIMGITEYPKAYEKDNGQMVIIPLEVHGVKVISLGLLIEEDQPVIWRGPMVTQLLRQFFYDVTWSPLDYLIIDMPPGTGDVALTMAQALPLSGSLIVTTPQAVATADVVKAMKMFQKVEVPLLGIVENMAYFVAPDTGIRYDIFGTGGAERLANQLDVPLLGQIPLGLSVRSGGDEGIPATTSDAPDAYAEVFRDVARQLAARISVQQVAAR
ncbi:MAG: Mrp/NBP35 family ATP-binding protein [Chloroflexaceae bacterium]|nr:Mrp/NBP35 family ATP-binding protein [Chloroflexaceae bacterium]